MNFGDWEYGKNELRNRRIKNLRQERVKFTQVYQK